MNVTLRSLLPLFLVLPAGLVHAQGCNIEMVVPDGRTETDSIPANGCTAYVFTTLSGHSYSVEQSRGLNRPTIFMAVGPSCPNNSSFSMNDTSTMDPAVNINTGSGQQRQRVAFACTAPVNPSAQPGQASATINNSGSAPYTFSLTVTDTTLQSPKWRAGANCDTFWTFTNLSSAPVNISINVLDVNGNPFPAPGLPNPGNISIAPGASISLDTTQIPQQFRTNPPPGTTLSGSVRVTEDGPPGAILAAAAIVTNAGGPTPTTETVKFEPNRH